MKRPWAEWRLPSTLLYIIVALAGFALIDLAISAYHGSRIQVSTDSP